MYVYIRTEPMLWTVGHYDPKTNRFIPESDWDNTDDAAKRVNYLNGGKVVFPVHPIDKEIHDQM